MDYLLGDEMKQKEKMEHMAAQIVELEHLLDTAIQVLDRQHALLVEYGIDPVTGGKVKQSAIIVAH